MLSCAVSRSLTHETGLLTGTVGLLEGNCMPGPNSEPCKPQPIETWVYITQPMEKFDKAAVVDSVLSNKKGAFKLNLKAGTYSVFAQYKSEVTCSQFKCDPDCACQPVTITTDSTTTVAVKINEASW